VKIKITEYFDGAELTEQTGQQPPVDNTVDGNALFPQATVTQQTQVGPWGMQTMDQAMPMAAPMSKKFYTLQRVNGNGGNGKGEGVAGAHKHTLEESDKVKKNSVIRWMMKNEKDKRKAQVSSASAFAQLHSCLSRYPLPLFFYLYTVIYLNLLPHFVFRRAVADRSVAAPGVKAACSCVMVGDGGTTSSRAASECLFLPTPHIKVLSPSPHGSVPRVLPLALFPAHNPFLFKSLSRVTPLATSSLFISQSPLYSFRAPLFRSFSLSLKMTDANQAGDSSKKTYHKKATGNALATVKSHSREDDLKLFGSCFW
jgi:hypothetical protein